MFDDDSVLIEQHAIENDDFQVQFHLINLFVSDNFVDRNAEMKQMKCSLLFSILQHEQKTYVLHDLDDLDKI